jgi:hypothetical protein
LSSFVWIDFYDVCFVAYLIDIFDRFRFEFELEEADISCPEGNYIVCVDSDRDDYAVRSEA